jgi:hypothetical protein
MSYPGEEYKEFKERSQEPESRSQAAGEAGVLNLRSVLRDVASIQEP